jgi:HD superfamily phosphohydrolase
VSRTYHDPLHGAITLDHRDPVEGLLIELIDTPAFQRLRRIRQLGPASLTFHGAETSRFTHSLGVLAVARRGFDRLAARHPSLAPHRATVLVAALLHDIGHGPFSHTAEEVFGSRHEAWTQRILLESDPVGSRLQQFDSALVTQVVQVYHHRHPLPLVWQLVSSQLDCDRIDYLLRDSYFTGASYGHLDLDRILLALDYDPDSQELVVARKGLAAIEHYLVVRYFMYGQIYNHPKNLAATWGLEQAISRARDLLNLGQLSADDTMTAWLTQNPQTLPLADYLAADDAWLLYHLQRWQRHPDPILSDLCGRFLDRRLLKAYELSHLKPAQQETVIDRVRSHLQTLNLSPDHYCGLRRANSRGYSLYQRGIKLRGSQGLEDINQISPLVQTLTQPQQRTWLIYPRDIADWLQAGGHLG